MIVFSAAAFQTELWAECILPVLQIQPAARAAAVGYRRVILLLVVVGYDINYKKIFLANDS